MVRPEAMAKLARWRDVLIAVGVAVFGLWLARSPGPVLAVIGGFVTLAGAAFALIAWRRMRFQLAVDAPGVVEITEGQISYMGPAMGGAVALSELSEVQVMVVAGVRRCWRLKQADGQTLLVPLAATGAQNLYDTLVSLQGMTHSDLDKALRTSSADPVTLWRRRDVHPRTVSIGGAS